MKPQTRVRTEIPDEYKWDLSAIFPSWQAWEEAYSRLESLIAAFAARRGSLASGAEALRGAFQAMDELGQLTYSVWYYPSLAHDEDQRDNAIGARRQQVQILLARWQQATSWFNPELLSLPLERVRQWMDADPGLGVYRFAIENLYRLHEHVLDDKGERLMSLVSRFDASPSDAYEALSTADAKFPTITLSDGRAVTVS
jgi:oligoendopeptidase F